MHRRMHSCSDFTQGLHISQNSDSACFVTKYYIMVTQQYCVNKSLSKLINTYLSILILDSRTQARTVNNTTRTEIDTHPLNLRHGHEMI